jgi:hypothetical protein
MDIALRRRELEQYAWLHKMADAQAKNINEYVRVVRVLLCPLRLTDPIQIPYVEFWLDIINTSVYDITVHTDTIKGHIKFYLNELLEGKQVIYRPQSIPPSERVNVNIKQRLNTTEVNLLKPYENKIEEALTLFHLSDLVITISGGTRFPQVEPKPLILPQDIGEELSARHKAEIDKLNEELREFRVAAGKLKVDIREHRIKRYVDLPDPACDGSLITLKVVLLNGRDAPLTIKDIKLDVESGGSTRTVYAEEGEVYEDRHISTAGALTYKGAKLDNLYLRGAASLTFAPKQVREGWLQFTLERILPTEIDGGSATLILTDSAGEEHRVGCDLSEGSVTR